MAEQVPPLVRMLFPCDMAVLDVTDQKWTLTNPWSVVMLPPGAAFPFRVVEFWVYAQFTGGVGDFDLAVEMRQVQDDDTRRTVAWSKATRMGFPSGQQLLAFDMAFHMKRVPFRGPGLYEFCVTVDAEEGHQVLAGQTAELRVLDRRAGL